MYDYLKVRIHYKDEDTWREFGALLLGLSRIVLAFVFLAPLFAAMALMGVYLSQHDLHPVFCVIACLLAAALVWYTFHTQRWLIMMYGTLYTAVVAGLVFTQLRDNSDPVWASAGSLMLAACGLALSWSVYKRHALARGWAF
jgi:asparagine N-glycosylation enzyme membrane subunit Stt3